MCDLPRMPVGIAKRAGLASVEGVCGLACDLGAVGTSLFDHLVYLLLRANVVSQGDCAPSGSVVGDAHVRPELLPRPQRQDDAVALKERRFVHLERR
jgi:hypothetical protein